jgi:hypothetical protein
MSTDMSPEEREALTNFCRGRYGDTAPEATAFRAGYRAALAARGEPRRTHGRHCPCSACAREDWTNPNLAPCGMHGPSCPAIYDPYPKIAAREDIERPGARGGPEPLPEERKAMERGRPGSFGPHKAYECGWRDAREYSKQREEKLQKALEKIAERRQDDPAPGYEHTPLVAVECQRIARAALAETPMSESTEKEEASVSAEGLTILQELAPYELGQGWPYKPHEMMECRALSATGYLMRRGRLFTITAKGRALVTAHDRRPL